MAEVRLLAFPYAGAGVSIFLPLAKALPAWVETWSLQLPARENVLAKQPIGNWNDFETFLIRQLDGWTGPKLAIYGHSLGAYAGLAAARIIETSFLQQGRSSPVVHLFFAAAPAPSLLRDTWLKQLSVTLEECNDDIFANLIVDHFGDPPTSFADSQIRETAIPIIRADLALLLSFKNEGTHPLSCGGTAIIGKQDPSTDHASAEAWKGEVASNIDVRSIDAGHFFVSTHVAETSEYISSALKRARKN